MNTSYKSTILIADDEQRGRETLESLLAMENYNLLFAANGYETLELAEKHKPDLILLDIMMPGMNGFEACRKIRTNDKLTEIPIILVTALDDKDSRIEGIKAGADDFITKPINSRELRLRIKTITRLDRFRQIQQGFAEKLRLEKELEKEKEINLLKSAFISIASHEFRTPLATISFATGFLSKYWQKLDADGIDQKLKRIESQVKHMIGLLEDVLILGKTDSGQTEIKPKLIPFLDFINPILEQIGFATNNKNEIKMNENATQCSIYIDEEIGKNIFINLLTNASKFSNERALIELNILNTESEAIVEVIDSGIGINNDELESIFTTFHRGSNVGTIQGTGLGLAIVKKSVERHHGKIKIESELGKGTKVSVTLPLK
jgi:two-component system, sensor histidine kinase and response regulator